MTRVRSSFVPILVPLFISVSPIVIRAAQPQTTPAATARLTSAANVTLRAMPSASAPAVAQLTLGTEVTDAGPAGLEKTWVHVKLADGREGWLLSSLTKPLTPGWHWPVYDRVIEERLGRKGDGFPALAELVAFIERVAQEYTDPDGRARIELSRLRATSAALAAIPVAGRSRDPYASWVAQRKAEIVYDEPGGRWLVSNAAILDLQSRYAASSSADDLAWFAVTNGLGGECEGYLPCYVSWTNRLQGEYLRRQPAGRHADEAVSAIKTVADVLVQPRKPGEAAYEFDAKRDCRDLTADVDALTAAVKPTRTATRDGALASLATLRKICQ